MNDFLYLGKQPIIGLDSKIFAYELLFRDDRVNEAKFSDSKEATAKLLNTLLNNMGLNSILGDKLGFVNVDERILLDDAIMAVPKDKIVLEILSSTKVTKELIEKIQKLKKSGFNFALNIEINESFKESFEKIFDFISYVKIDLTEFNRGKIAKYIKESKSENISFIAEKVEMEDDYNWALESGFEYFQGYFFQKPTVVKAKGIEPHVSHLLELIRVVNSEDNLSKVAQKFADSPTLIVNLLSYLNSALFFTSKRISSIKQAISLIGRKQLLAWLTLFLYSNIKDNKFSEALFNSSLYRAKMMKKLAIKKGYENLKDEAFLIGALSLLDTMLNLEMESILSKLNLEEGINLALLSREGVLGELLSRVEQIECLRDSDFYTISKLLNISQTELSNLTIDVETLNK